MNGQTPHLTVSDPRGLTVRSVDYCRSVPGATAESRVHHTLFDARGRLVEQRDPRLWALPQAPANLATVHSLSGQVVRSDGVDNGFCCDLWGEAGQVLQQWDGRGQRRVDYDTLLRPLAVFERLAEQAWQCSERLAYADGRADHGQHNRCGRLLRHDDPAGTCHWPGFSLTGEASHERRRFLDSTDWPDWPVDRDARDALLEPGEGASTAWRHGPLGEVLEQIDAAGHRQSFHSNLSGELQQVRLQLAGQPEQTLLSQALYSAQGQMLEETLGNGVTIQRTYCAQDGRLLNLSARRDIGKTLLDLHYGYDPAGNVTSLEDRAQPLRHFANQRIEPLCEYRYDSLYQLIEATGWEAGTSNRGPGTLNDPQAGANYRQTYRYDASGNLLELAHVGVQSHGRILAAARHSNRCLAQIDGRPPNEDDFLERFDANGNLLALQPGSRLHWDVRNQLSDIRPVKREGDADDVERYVYDAAGQRLRKSCVAQAAGRSLISEVRYLPGLELRESRATGEHLQVITVQAGTCNVRVLHWLGGRPDQIAQDQQRYALTDHLGSSMLELDAHAALVSLEVYHPFGSTAWLAGRSEVEASYKTIRYSGKERDATGLYYYGARYYMPWLQRWLSPDPSGAVDGLNLYCMVNNSPLRYRDPDGRQGVDDMDLAESEAASRGTLHASGLKQFPPADQKRVRAAAALAGKLAGKALEALEGGRGGENLRKILFASFGTFEPPAPDADGISLEQRLRAVRPYVESLGKKEGWRLMLVTTYPESRAYTRKTSSGTDKTRIAITRALLDKHDDLHLTSALLHESFHAVGFAQADPRNYVSDMWYTTPSGGTFSLERLRSNSHSVRLSGPDVGAMPISDRRHFYDIVYDEMRRQKLLPKFVSPGDFAWRTDAFLNYPTIRVNSGLRNADTLTGIAMAFHKPRFKMPVTTPSFRTRMW